MNEQVKEEVRAGDDAVTRVWTALEEVCDPEIPVLSLVDLKIIRSVAVEGKRVRVVMTPTFSGCPALTLMKGQVEEKLLSLGFEDVGVEFSHAEPWQTNMLGDTAKEKMRDFGIAPPVVVEMPQSPHTREQQLHQVLQRPVACPFCGSEDTKLDSFFGATLCKQLFFCHACRQSFDRFKPV